MLISISLTTPALKLRTDNPGGHWLKNEQDYNAEKGKNKHGAPARFGAITGSWNRHVLLPVELLATFKGLANEQGAVRKADLDWLKDHMSKNKRLPYTNDDDARHYAPYVVVWQDGSVWVNEGNHRIMAAKALHIKYLPVELRYFAGGEEVKSGALAPSKVIEYDRDAHALGYTLTDYVK